MRIEIDVGKPDVAVYGFDQHTRDRGMVRVKVRLPAVQISRQEWLGGREITLDSLGPVDEDHIVAALREALWRVSYERS